MQALQALVTNACRAGSSAGAPPTPRVRCCKTMRCVELEQSHSDQMSQSIGSFATMPLQ